VAAAAGVVAGADVAAVDVAVVDDDKQQRRPN